MMWMNNISKQLYSSFRDPGGFLFKSEDKLYRQINKVSQSDFILLEESGLYKKLVNDRLIVPYRDVHNFELSNDVYKVIEPEIVKFISYPYEWCFSQLKDAALTTLRIQKIALKYDMSLKDASAFNIQWHKGRPMLIDTLSFEKYKEGEPWVAYKQFCQHFLAPLVLMSYKDIRLNKFSRICIDGIPLDLVSALLPKSTYLKFNILSHIHLHAKSQKHFADKNFDKKKVTLSKFSLLGIIDGLESVINKLKWQPKGTEWGDYYTFTNYSDGSFNQKKTIIKDFLIDLNSKTLWDVGGNTGEFSRIASDMGIQTISFDIDEAAIEKSYLIMKKNNESNILPLVIDWTNPSPSIGWCNQERFSLIERGPVDTVLALAIIHHLAISNNVPFVRIADFFSKICNNLIIEFVPKEDSQVKKLLSTREDVFTNYTEANFLKVFSDYFTDIKTKHIDGSTRTLYLMKK